MAAGSSVGPFLAPTMVTRTGAVDIGAATEAMVTATGMAMAMGMVMAMGMAMGMGMVTGMATVTGIILKTRKQKKTPS